MNRAKTKTMAAMIVIVIVDQKAVWLEVEAVSLAV